MREFHHGAEWDVLEVRHVWEHDGVQLGQGEKGEYDGWFIQ